MGIAVFPITSLLANGAHLCIEMDNNSAQRSVKRMRQSDFNYNTYLDMHEGKLERVTLFYLNTKSAHPSRSRLLWPFGNTIATVIFSSNPTLITPKTHYLQQTGWGLPDLVSGD